jgi:hypothetical protein
MQEIYQNIAENINTNPQMFPFIEWCRRVKHITIVGFAQGLATLCALSAKQETIVIYDNNKIDISEYQEIANNNNIKLVFYNKMILENEVIEDTDLLFINSFQEGNFVMTVCQKFAQFVNCYIAIQDTYTFAHQPAPGIQLGNGGQPIGMIFGINHFIQNNDPWHIAENLYWEPGLTLLYRRKDLLDNGTE